MSDPTVEPGVPADSHPSPNSSISIPPAAEKKVAEVKKRAPGLVDLVKTPDKILLRLNKFVYHKHQTVHQILTLRPSDFWQLLAVSVHSSQQPTTLSTCSHTSRRNHYHSKQGSTNASEKPPIPQPHLQAHHQSHLSPPSSQAAVSRFVSSASHHSMHGSVSSCKVLSRARTASSTQRL
jgi:hypothetical protein